LTDPSVSALHRGLLGTAYAKPQTPAFPGPVAITVVAGGTPGGVRFTVDGYGSDWAFGPALFPRPSMGQVPPAGTKGIAMFSADSASTWLICLFDWP